MFIFCIRQVSLPYEFATEAICSVGWRAVCDGMKQEATLTQPEGIRGLNDACNHGKEESSGFLPFKSQGILVPYLWLLLGSFSMKRGIICQVISTLGANDGTTSQNELWSRFGKLFFCEFP